jgi:hypothetical protein
MTTLHEYYDGYDETDDYAWDVDAYEPIATEKRTRIGAIEEYVCEIWDGAGCYEVEDYDGSRIVVCEVADDLVFDIYEHWDNGTARKVG